VQRALSKPKPKSLLIGFVGVERMQMLATRVKHAFLVSDLLNMDKTLLELLGSVIARAGFGVVLAAADRRIVYANDTAETLMRASNSLRCERDCISATDFKTSRKLQSLITAASQQTDESGQGGSLIVRDEDGVASLVVHVVPLSPRSAVLPPDKGCPVAGLVIVGCQPGTTDRINVFADLFALTSAEAHVVSQLISGGCLTKAATRLNIAPSTARSHLTHIFEKTDTHRQAELVRVFYEITIPWYVHRRKEDKGRAASAGGLAVVRCGARSQGVKPQLFL
jgi:DNA-binding CsgD family transcriptional regulator